MKTAAITVSKNFYLLLTVAVMVMVIAVCNLFSLYENELDAEFQNIELVNVLEHELSGTLPEQFHKVRWVNDADLSNPANMCAFTIGAFSDDVDSDDKLVFGSTAIMAEISKANVDHIDWQQPHERYLQMEDDQELLMVAGMAVLNDKLYRYTCILDSGFVIGHTLKDS